jgi:hypothetical protein
MGLCGTIATRGLDPTSSGSPGTLANESFCIIIASITNGKLARRGKEEERRDSRGPDEENGREKGESGETREGERIEYLSLRA